jgi:hypothetical protein
VPADERTAVASVAASVPAFSPITMNFPRPVDRALLLNPPVFDTRLHWAKWQQPAGLLQLGSRLQRAGADVKLIDALYQDRDARLRRERVASLDLDGSLVQKWRFGISKHALLTQLRTLARSGWHPDEIYVEGFCTFWWEGVAEVIAVARQVFPRARVMLVGAYAVQNSGHARRYSGADEIVQVEWVDLVTSPIALSLYGRPPHFVYLTLGNDARSVGDVVEEVIAAIKQKVIHLAFSDHAVARRFPDLYCAVLEELARRRLRLCLYALGNLAPQDLVDHPELADLMKRAGYKQVYFADDREALLDRCADDQLIESYAKAAELCNRAGFRDRTDALNAGLSLGRRGEDLAGRARLATLLAHHIGSIVFWPYQPSPAECPDLPLEAQNGKLFPLRHANGATYRSYQDLLGLAVVLNAKYRSRTFDFLGDGLVPRLFRDSLRRRAWEPPAAVKGSLQLPMVRA